MACLQATAKLLISTVYTEYWQTVLKTSCIFAKREGGHSLVFIKDETKEKWDKIEMTSGSRNFPQIPLQHSICAISVCVAGLNCPSQITPCFKVKPQDHKVPGGALKILLRSVRCILELSGTPPECHIIDDCVCSCSCFAVFTYISKGDLISNPSMRDMWDKYLKSFPTSLYLGQLLTYQLVSPDIPVSEQPLCLGTLLINFPLVWFVCLFFISMNMIPACSDTDDLHVHHLTIWDMHAIHK